MASKIDIRLIERNDQTVRFIITPDDPADNLQVISAVEVYLKPTASTSDNDAAVVKLSSADPSQLVVASVAPSLVAATAYIPAPAVAAPGVRFWRCDVLVGTQRRTAAYGTLTVIDV